MLYHPAVDPLSKTVFAEGSLTVLLMAIRVNSFKGRRELVLQGVVAFFFFKVRASQGELEAEVY